MFEPKYIKTKDNQIVIFPASFQHSQFKHLDPVSAGFIMINNERKPGHNLILNLLIVMFIQRI